MTGSCLSTPSCAGSHLEGEKTATLGSRGPLEINKLMRRSSSVGGSMDGVSAPEKEIREDEESPSQKRKDIFYWDPKSLRIRTINWGHLFIVEYLEPLCKLVLMLVLVRITYHILAGRFEFQKFRALLSDMVTLEGFAFVTLLCGYMQYRRAAIYCIENAVFKPPSEWQVSHADVDSLYAFQGCFSETAQDFLQKITAKSATGQHTHLPPNMLESIKTGQPIDKSVKNARVEAELVVFAVVEEVLLKARIKPKDIDILIINCSLFSPTPSLCAMVCHKFGMRSDIKSYNLSGMGCSANLISIDLAKQLLQNSPGSRALVVSTENISQNLYEGNDKSMLLQNTLFRVGGCAQLLTSRFLDVWKAKYKLLYTGRTQVSDTNSYHCVFEREDAEGHRGIGLSKDIVKVAGTAMKHNFVRLAPHVLPIREQARTLATQSAISLVLLLKKSGLKFADRLTVPKGYIPNFALGIDHFCIHAGGRAVIEGVQENLRLSDRHTLPSKATLHDWGNTSSSSIWYEAEWIERFGSLKAGHRILQIAFGSGFKCNSAVWLTLRVDESKRGIPLVAGSNIDHADAPVLKSNKAA